MRDHAHLIMTEISADGITSDVDRIEIYLNNHFATKENELVDKLQAENDKLNAAVERKDWAKNTWKESAEHCQNAFREIQSENQKLRARIEHIEEQHNPKL